MLCVMRSVRLLNANKSDCIIYIYAYNSPAGTSRQAELRPNLPSHLFAAVRDKNTNAQNPETSNLPSRHPEGNLNRKDAEKPKTNTSHPQGRDMVSIKTKSRQTGQSVDDFDGDDLQLDDFLAVNEPRGKAKESTRPRARQFDDFDDIDWFSIDATPPSPARGVPKVSNPREDDWAADLEEPEDEYEPVRLANGKWACNHKCRDKTRFEKAINFLIVKLVKLMVAAASISAVARGWKGPRSRRSGQALRPRRKVVSIN